MGKLETRIKRALNAIADECGDDMWLFNLVVASKPQPRNNAWSEVMIGLDLDVTGQKAVGNTKAQARAIASELVSVSDDEALEQIADWLDDALATRVDVLRDKLEQKHEKLGAASPDAPLGRYAWATDRNGMKQRRVPGEPNTSEEDRLLKAFDAFIAGHQPMPEQPAKQLQTLLKRDLYTDVVHEPAAQVLYRGLTLSAVNLAKLLKIKTKDIPNIRSRGSAKLNVKVRPDRGHASHWTDDRGVAISFSREVDTHRPYSVILHATQNDNSNRFIAGPNGFYKVGWLDRFKAERESIGIGPIVISRVEWFKAE